MNADTDFNAAYIDAAWTPSMAGRLYTDSDVRHEVIEAIEGSGVADQSEYDIDAIASSAYEFNPRLGEFVSTATEGEFWGIVQRHALAERAYVYDYPEETRRVEVALERMDAVDPDDGTPFLPQSIDMAIASAVEAVCGREGWTGPIDLARAKNWWAILDDLTTALGIELGDLDDA